MSEERRILSISTSTILKVLGVAVAVYLFYLVWEILLLLFVSFILATLIDPFASNLARRKIPRSLAVLIVYVVLFGLIGFAVAMLAPVIASDLPQLVKNLEQTLATLKGNETVQTIISFFGNPVNSSGMPSGGSVLPTAGNSAISGVFGQLANVLGGIVSLALILVMTFYLVVQEDPLKKILTSIVPDESVPYASELLERIRTKLGVWLRAQLVLSLIVGVLVFLGLSILGVKYAAVLALAAALLEFIPYMGPVIASIPALLLGFSEGGAVTLFLVLAMYVIVQQLENHVLIPKIMQRAVGLNPIVSIIALLIGAKLAGFLGALIAIPVATAASVFVKDVLAARKNEEASTHITNSLPPTD